MEDDNKSDLKQDAKDTFNEAKEQMKDLNFKEELEKGKGVIKNLFKKPIETVEEITENSNTNLFKTGLIIWVIWIIIIGLRNILNVAAYKYVDFSIKSFLTAIASPILEIVVLVGAIYVLNKKNKKPISTTFTAIIVAYIPTIIGKLISYLTFINSNVSYITSPIIYLLNLVTTILTFFVVKGLFGDDDMEVTFKNYLKVIAIFYVCYFVLSFFGVYI